MSTSKTATPITIEIEHNGEAIELDFNMSPADYIQHINELQADDKYAPFHNLLARTVTPDHQSTLTEVLNAAPLALELGGLLMGEFMPKVKAKVKKRN
jgi:hypothetical protein